MTRGRCTGQQSREPCLAEMIPSNRLLSRTLGITAPNRDPKPEHTYSDRRSLDACSLVLIVVVGKCVELSKCISNALNNYLALRRLACTIHNPRHGEHWLKRDNFS